MSNISEIRDTWTYTYIVWREVSLESGNKKKRITQDDSSVVDTGLSHSELLWEKTIIFPGTWRYHPFLASTIASTERNPQPYTSQESQHQNLWQDPLAHCGTSLGIPIRSAGIDPFWQCARWSVSFSQFCPLPFSVKGVFISLINKLLPKALS